MEDWEYITLRMLLNAADNSDLLWLFSHDPFFFVNLDFLLSYTILTHIAIGGDESNYPACYTGKCFR